MSCTKLLDAAVAPLHTQTSNAASDVFNSRAERLKLPLLQRQGTEVTFHNTRTSFGSVARLLHWTVAALFLAEYCVIYGKHWFTEEDSTASMTLLQLHQIIGISIMVFVVGRIVWRIANDQPASVPGPYWARFGAGFVHAALYFFMVAMPISGYLYASNATEIPGALRIPAFENIAVAQWLISTWDISLKEVIREPMRTFHREIAGALMLWILILVHMSAALYHHFIVRDEVLLRMLPNILRGRIGKTS